MTTNENTQALPMGVKIYAAILKNFLALITEPELVHLPYDPIIAA